METTFSSDVMQVCRNGHVVTEQVRACPEQSRYHCEVCSAPTISSCPTCGHEIAGAVVVPGVTLMGLKRAPDSCSTCGAPFPWAGTIKVAPDVSQTAHALALETMLRRLPLTIRRLRNRRPDRPAFRVKDHYDLEELVQALLPLLYDEVRVNSRTPSYSLHTRTDFIVPEDRLALTVKIAAEGLAQQIEEDVAAYRKEKLADRLWVYIYDPRGCLRDTQELERLWSSQDSMPAVRCVISG